MDVSVVVPTLNARERLASCLDALAAHAPDVEVVVVNGPSADGTSGMVRDRADVDVLVEIDERNVNVARNAGLDRTSGDVVAFLDDVLAVESGWLAALRSGLDRSAADDDREVGAVTGPTHEQVRTGHTTETVEDRRILGRAVTYFNGGNAAFRRPALGAIDGFDEYLQTGGARDAAHRLAGSDYGVEWVPSMSVRRELGADGGRRERDWAWRYRSLAYRLVKNYGPRPSVAYRIGRHAVDDAWTTLRKVGGGEVRPSEWFASGRDVATGTAVGVADGLRARLTDRSPRRNPNGWSARTDRAVSVEDWR